MAQYRSALKRSVDNPLLVSRKGRTDYTIRPYLLEDEAPVLALLRVCLTSSTSQWQTPELWRWKHYANPFGTSHVLVAQASTGEIIGVRPMMRWAFSCLSQAVDAVRPVDTVTHPNFRGAGVFTNLVSHATRQLEEEGVQLIFNTPNSLSLGGYLKMGWSSLGPLNAQLKIAKRPTSLVKLVMGLLRGRFQQHAPKASKKTQLPAVQCLLRQPGLENLLKHNGRLNPCQIATEKNTAYLKWRYPEHPSLPYHVLWDEHRGQVRGCVIVRPTTQYGLCGLIIEDILLMDPDIPIAAGLIEEATRLSSADFVMACFSARSFQWAVLDHARFHRHFRKGMNFVVRPLHQDLPLDPRHIDNWAISMGDLEFF